MIFLFLNLPDYKATQYGNLAITISAFGVLGTNFASGVRLPSLEFPINSKTEHLTIAGIWIGAITPQGDTLVSTSAVDEYANSSVSGEGFEFRKLDSVKVRSLILTSPYYDPNAKADEEIMARFDDYSNVVNHNPLGVEVHLRAFLYTYEYIEDIVFLEYKIINKSSGDLRKVYLAIYSELVTGNRIFWGSDFARTPFFQHKRLFYNDSLKLVYERNSGYDTIAKKISAGFQILGIIKNNKKIYPESLNVSFIWKAWNPNQVYPDKNKYLDISRDTIFPNVDDNYLLNNPYPDPTSVVSVGPIDYLESNDTIVFYVAIVGGIDEENIKKNAGWAKVAFERDFLLPAPPPSPKLIAITDNRKVNLYWDSSPESFIDPFSNEMDFEGYRVLRGKSKIFDSTWLILAQYDKTNNIGYDAGLPKITNNCPSPLNSPCYYYEDEGVKNGYLYYYSVISFDKGYLQQGIPVLYSSYRQNLLEVIPGSKPSIDLPLRIYPNPFKFNSNFNGVYISNLPKRGKIYIYNLAGDLVFSDEFYNEVRGEYFWNLKNKSGFQVAPGVYIVVVEDDETKKTRRTRLGIVR